MRWIFHKWNCKFMSLESIREFNSNGTWRSLYMVVGATDKSALIWKQRRDHLSIQWKMLTINATTIVGVLSSLNLHWFYLYWQQKLSYMTMHLKNNATCLLNEMKQHSASVHDTHLFDETQECKYPIHRLWGNMDYNCYNLSVSP